MCCGDGEVRDEVVEEDNRCPCWDDRDVHSEG